MSSQLPIWTFPNFYPILFAKFCPYNEFLQSFFLQQRNKLKKREKDGIRRVRREEKNSFFTIYALTCKSKCKSV